MNTEIIYPIAAFSRGNMISFARSPEDLSKCSRYGLKNGYYNELLIVDSSGNVYKIKNAKQKEIKKQKFGIKLIFGLDIQVNLNFYDEVKTIEIQEFKNRILKIFNKDKYFWNSGDDLNQKISFIKNSSSFEQLLIFMTEQFYKIY